MTKRNTCATLRVSSEDGLKITDKMNPDECKALCLTSIRVHFISITFCSCIKSLNEKMDCFLTTQSAFESETKGLPDEICISII